MNAETGVDDGCGGRAWGEQRARERMGGWVDWSDRELLVWVVVSMAVRMWKNGREGGVDSELGGWLTAWRKGWRGDRGVNIYLQRPGLLSSSSCDQSRGLLSLLTNPRTYTCDQYSCALDADTDTTRSRTPQSLTTQKPYSNRITFSCLSYSGASTAHGTISLYTPVP